VLALSVAGPVAATSQPRCFGAAARDPLHPCANPSLRLRVTPTPSQALITPNLACEQPAVANEIEQCSYGVPVSQAVATVAVLGDSHGAHWRAAIDYVAKAEKWRVDEFAIPHCPFSQTQTNSGAAVAAWCPQWNQAVLAWLQQNPQVQTIFVSANARDPIVTPPGQGGYATRVAGYVDEWKMLPASVQRIVVIRDDPIDVTDTFNCVQKAIDRRRPAGTACRLPRHPALIADPEVSAAQQLTGRGVGVVDMTPQFCDAHYCYPVVGGVLVHKDVDHLGQLFAQTLGPFLLRGLDDLLATPVTSTVTPLSLV
jgi:hypothetical protein